MTYSPRHIPDLSSRNGAIWLAQRIRTYWLLKGVTVKTRFEVLSEHGDKPLYCLRSDLKVTR